MLTAMVPNELSPKARNLMISEILDQNQSISEVSKKYGVSRVTIYKWIKRHKEELQRDGQVQLVNKERIIDRYWRQTPDKYEEAILSLVGQHPEWGIRTLVKNLPKVGNTPIVGHHGVQNVLRRRNLSIYNQRLDYAQSLRTPTVGFIERALVSASDFFKIPAAQRHTYIRFFTVFGVALFATIVLAGAGSYVYGAAGGTGLGYKVGLFFALLALATGTFFFLYSLKYYLTLALVLSFSQKENDEIKEAANDQGMLNWLLKKNTNTHESSVGLTADLSHIKLTKKPFISVQVPFYNEKNVVERSIHAAVSFDYPSYEVILCDDSTDETTQLIEARMKRYLFEGEKLKTTKGEGWTLTEVEVKPGVFLKHLHRTSRSGFKGGALDLALKLCDPRTEKVAIFDADFVPYPDSLTMFLKYFQAQNDPKAAAVQGYQWHVLNKSENWITRGVRSEYAGSYVIERSGAEIYGGLKQISGSVYMIKKEVLEEIGWGTSITEDFELTLRLYEAGYKVIYTPYIQAPAECASTLKRLIRQRMRWAEGHSFNVKKMFIKLLMSPKLTFAEKFEFVYLTPYYLQAFFFLTGTLSWLISETVFRVTLPFWTELWGWSLVLTNMISLPLLNSVGLFLEESEERDYTGLGSFMALSYIMVPFQAYAAVKGFVEKEEGPWFRTPKTGRITDTFARGKFYRFISGILPAKSGSSLTENDNYRYLSLSTANNRFDSFNLKKAKNRMWVSKLFLSVLLIFTTTVSSMSSYIGTFDTTTINKPASGVIRSLNSALVSEVNAQEGDISGINSYKLDQKPQFLVSDQRPVYLKAINSIKNKLGGHKPDFGSEIKTKLVNAGGEEINAKVKVETEGDAARVVVEDKLPEPGVYKVVVEYPGKTVETDFSWGVLSINPNKSVYKPNEKANFSMAVLDDNGDMVCNADVMLSITNPQGERKVLSTENGGVDVNPECMVHNFTLEPDYEAEYEVSSEGRYSITLSAKTENGERIINDSFEVKKDIEFDVARNTVSTRIYPLKDYPVVIEVTPQNDYKGVITDYLPSNFDALTSPEDLWGLDGLETWTEDQKNEFYGNAVAGTAREVSETTQAVDWLVDWEAGQTYRLAYAYDAPNESPAAYTLGPLEINGRPEETRKWQLAIDSVNLAGGVVTSLAGAGTSQSSFSYTVSSGSNRVLVVMVSTEDTTDADRVISSMTWNTSENFVAARNQQNDTDNVGANIYYLVNPTATASNIVINFAGAVTSIGVTAFTLFNVDQTNPLDNNNGANQSNTDAPNVSITTNSDYAYVVSVNTNNANTTLTSTQTELSDYNMTASRQVTSSTQVDSAGSQNMGYTGGGATNDHAQAVASFKTVADSIHKVGTVTASTAGAGTAQSSFSHTVPSTGSNRLLVVLVSTDDTSDSDRVISSVTWNTSENLTAGRNQQNDTNNVGASIYYLANPTATTANIVVNFAGLVSSIGVTAFTINNVDQSSPVDANNGSDQENTATPNLSITTNTDTTFIASVIANNANGELTSTQEEITDMSIANARQVVSVTTGGSAGSHNMGYTAGDATHDYAQAVVAFKKATSGITVSGTANGNDGATVSVAINGTAQGQTATIGSSIWSITGVAAPSADDIITVWVNNVTDGNESTAVTKYASGSTVSGMVLDTNVLTIGSNQNTGLTVTNLNTYDCTEDEDVMHQAASSVFSVQGASCAGSTSNTYSAEEVEILSGDSLTIGGTETLNTYDLTITGTLTSSGNSTYNIEHNWAKTGTFTSSTSTVNLTGADATTQVFTGSTSFNNLSASTSSNSAGRTIRFTAGTTQTVTGTWTVTGASGKVITLESSTTSAWTINPTAASVTYVSVSYSTNTGATFCATNSTDGGNNTSWTISAGANCQTVANSFQRKTWFDGTRYWRGSLDQGNSRIIFEYSSDGSSWTENSSARISVSTTDFSIDADSGNAFIVYTTTNDTKGRKASSYPGTGFSWGSEETVFDGSGATDDYDYPVVMRDSSSNVWVAARFTGSSVYYIQTIKEAGGTNDLPEESGDTVLTIGDTTNSDSNVYANVVSLGSQNMYINFSMGTTLAGCKWVNASSQWQDSSGSSCESGPDLSSGLVAYWKMDEASWNGTTDQVVDSSGNNRHGTSAGNATTVADNFNRAGTFDGTGDYVDVFGSPVFDITGDFTLSAWVSRSGGSNGYIISKTHGTDGGYALLHGNSGEVYCRTSDGVGFVDSFTSTGQVTTGGGWHHVVAVRSGTSCRVYVDGVDQTSTDNTHTTLEVSANNVAIGAAPGGGTGFNGRIDDARIYNTALSSSEVTTLFNFDPTVSSTYDSVDTIPANLSDNFSSVSDGSGNVYLTYVDDESTDQISHKKYNGTSWSSAALVADAASGDDSYVSLSYDSTNSSIIAFWIDTAVSDIYYSICSISTNCDAASEWGSEVAWKTTGTNTAISSNYSASGVAFAVWASSGGINWDVIVVPENLWLFMALVPFLGYIKRKWKVLRLKL